MKKAAIPIIIILSVLTIMIYTTVNAQNPLLGTFDTPHGIIPFGQVKPEHILPAFEYALEEARTDIRAIVENSEPPTFENTIHAFEILGERRLGIFRYVRLLDFAISTPEINKIAGDIAVMNATYINENLYNEALFEKVKAIYDGKDNLNLNVEQIELLDMTYRWFARNGIDLPSADKERLKEINERLTELSMRFGQNVTTEQDSRYLYLPDEEDLAGLPDWLIGTAKEYARSRQLEGWAIPISGYVPYSFVQYSEHRHHREELMSIRAAVGNSDNEYNNIGIATEILNLRLEKARLLGHKTYADYSLMESMASTPRTVIDFIDRYNIAVTPIAKREFDEIQSFARSAGFTESLQEWDLPYYQRRSEEHKFHFNPDEVKPYLPIDHVLAKTFEMVQQMWGLRFEINYDLPKYHDDLMSYEVFDESGEIIAVLYLDMYQREAKGGGANMANLRMQYKKQGTNIIPVGVMNCNFTKSGTGSPSLLNMAELSTFLHELGHGLHLMLSDVTYASLSGYAVYGDFLELPSMLLEKWAYEKEFLKFVGKHHQTGEGIPSDLIEKIYDSRHAGVALQARQYMLPFSLLDMIFHQITEPVTGNICDIESSVLIDFHFFPSEGCFTPTFNHVFSYGYAANCYSYDWSDMMAYDIFRVFKEKGIFDRETARRFAREILSKGGTVHPMELFKNFMGREPDSEAVLGRFK